MIQAATGEYPVYQKVVNALHSFKADASVLKTAYQHAIELIRSGIKLQPAAKAARALAKREAQAAQAARAAAAAAEAAGAAADADMAAADGGDMQVADADAASQGSLSGGSSSGEEDGLQDSASSGDDLAATLAKLDKMQQEHAQLLQQYDELKQTCKTMEEKLVERNRAYNEACTLYPGEW